jgi:hypothetical protein
MTSKVLSARIPDYLVRQVSEFQEAHRLTSQGEALRLLLEAGLKAGDTSIDWGSLEAIQANARAAAIDEVFKLLTEVLRQKGYTK